MKLISSDVIGKLLDDGADAADLRAFLLCVDHSVRRVVGGVLFREAQQERLEGFGVIAVVQGQLMLKGPAGAYTTVAEGPLSVEYKAGLAELSAYFAKRITGFRGARYGQPEHTSARWLKDLTALADRGPLEGNGKPIELWEIEGMIRFIFDDLAEPQGEREFCWASVVWSPAKLRKHWNRIENEQTRQMRKKQHDPFTFANFR